MVTVRFYSRQQRRSVRQHTEVGQINLCEMFSRCALAYRPPPWPLLSCEQAKARHLAQHAIRKE
jgi:hypothetical protein